jgi:hypothetical protein
MIAREGLDMFREFLARLIPTRRPFHRGANRTAGANTRIPSCNTGLGEVYHAHAAIHGPNMVLPVDALPHQAEPSQTSRSTGRAKLT